MLVVKFSSTSSQLEYSLWCNTASALRNLWLADNPDEVLNEYLSLLVGRYVRTTAIHLGNKDQPWFDDQCRHVLA